MLHRQLASVSFCAAAVFLVVQANPNAAAAKDDAKVVKVAGILIDKTGDTLTVKPDGEDDPVKYSIPKTDKKLNDTLKSVYNACRVKLSYKKDGDTLQLTSVARHIIKANGTMTGTVVKVYNDFWVEVKPKEGVNDAFAPSVANYKMKEFMDMLKGLKPGESVTIKYTTDGERHRIETMKKNEPK